MSINELKENIMSKQIYDKYNNKLVFVVKDDYILKIILKLLLTNYNAIYHYCLDLKEIIDNLSSKDLFSKNKVYVIKNVNYFIKNPEKLLSLKITKNNILILLYDDININSEFYNLLKDNIYYFSKLNLNQLKTIIKNKIDLNDKNCEILCNITDFNSDRILNEINNLNILNNINKEDINLLFLKSLKENLIYIENNQEYNYWVDSIYKKNFKETIEIANKISQIDDDIFRLINLLYELYKSQLISPSTKRNYSKKELVNNLNFLHNIEMNIKEGKIEEEFVRNYIMINLILNERRDYEKFI